MQFSHGGAFFVPEKLITHDENCILHCAVAVVQRPVIYAAALYGHRCSRQNSKDQARSAVSFTRCQGRCSTAQPSCDWSTATLTSDRQLTTLAQISCPFVQSLPHVSAQGIGPGTPCLPLSVGPKRRPVPGVRTVRSVRGDQLNLPQHEVSGARERAKFPGPRGPPSFCIGAFGG